MIKIMERAVKELKRISEEEGLDECSVRVKINSGGCSGFTFDLIFDEIVLELDEVFHQDGIKILIDQCSMQYMSGIELNYVDSLIGGGFTFGGGQITNTCGCGKSVSF